MLGLLFSGQGAQKTGVTQDLYEQMPVYRQTLDQASTILGYDLPKLLFDPEQADRLAQTRYAQPVILTISWGLYNLLQPHLNQDVIGLGLSLGEYSALACGGYFDFPTALEVIKKRGELMQEASDENPSKMVALMRAPLSAVEEIVAQAQGQGLVVGVANVNTPQQTVLGGELAAVDQVVATLQAQVQCRAIELKVSGAFHTPVMQPIQARLAAKLKTVSWQAGQFPVWSTTTKQPFVPAELTTTLTDQLVSTTYFAATLGQLAPQLSGVIEVGPGKTLLGFARKIQSGIATHQIDSVDRLEATIAAIGD
ncbi:ACP S-malonyltransferase [Lactobacillus sp. DCY120]|uniref:Malonyl CoA-acyl carrier protein transacylase n=1 Tax=Bombilactobacillus apium TaxID=2675299 RepID=A0A850R820_9LACO|nr:ACP S-malonyltransferase [Bombilactobacillus apium]NVY96685.1 ACP S-malonyltransferase [Bombilactobacillus apium]